MNERIKELALQAGEYANSVYTPPVRSKTPGKIWEDGHIDWHEIFNQKFAELIVRECAFVAQNKDDTDINFRLARGLAAFKILQHFGVEE
jgi:hypothetical protein